MRTKINIYLVEYAINSLLRQKYKTLFITLVLTALIFLLSSIFFITNSIKYELQSTVDSLPEITVQKINGGRHYDIEVSVADDILAITGVKSAVARVWGYYYFENAGVNFSVVGIDEYEEQYKNSLTNVAKTLDFSASSMILGAGVKKIINENYYKEYFNFIKPDGTLKRVDIGGVFDTDTELESNDVIVMSKESVREIFDMSENKATDIVVKVANEDEIATVALKIKLLYPDSRVITKDDLKISYQNIFDYKSGIFLALFVVSLFTFFIIIYDKLSGLSSEEKREIGVLKAIGWRVDDVLKEKFYEGFIVSFFSYMSGVILALFFVYMLRAPLLQNIFTGYSQLKTSFTLPFVFDMQTLALIFFLSVPIYIAATIIPSWRSAALEADEVIR
ncbi:MAG: ABC transporter permease [Sulfurimonas sp. RIFCSPHIGHO2_12_FULL_36_9]|uniref:ABC transporter permease n=1 Tax=Sulfurimonas sp. RIFCSPLOWO2_12_36_12 TaxID=1802253 RepID=UPI0008D207A6|nr:FtsX-like permease family protein [Sulfurimonas sp. RIFCSPLOWO2_12_36_12]OHD99273.1 MAG: ABC transporter permease [Sulfurimonas sp. RIFCSPHIGHO2_12_FULL_36_9]OHE00400.1 MAG: ABC transporter permease [Sulfurimonas sp. RIFCSPLOWO2_02_FULL_36_28]OHE01486.1 MAG: ABC transporter permease [Sulfurimonas sp. RIFCSPLOWO2_12_36_12]